MSGRHYSNYPPQRTSSGSAWKVTLLVVLLVVVILALGFLVYQLVGADLLSGLGIGGGSATANVAPGIFTQVGAEYGSGKNVAGNISVTESTQRPEEIPQEADVVLLDISWTGKKPMSEPLYLTVSDPSFIDGDGLAVYHFNSTGTWDKIGEYEIRDSSVTFLATSLSPFAFQVLSSQPEATATAEPTFTPEPTVTPEPTPVPTPAPINVVDYGTYTGVKTGAYALASELEDDQVYVVAMVTDLPADAVAAADDTSEGGEDTSEAEDTSESESSDGGLTISYVDAPEASAPAEIPADQTGTGAAPVANAPTASVLVNLNGSELGLVEMPLIQTDDGTWCLGGPVTEGMLWTSNRDAYKDEHRFSLKNNDRYLNLDDNDQNMILNDNRTRTRWLIETATLSNGTSISTMDYRNGARYYVNQMAAVAETLPAAPTPTQAPDGTTPAAASPIYVGMSAPANTALVRTSTKLTVTEDQAQSLQLMAFKFDESMTAPAGVATTLEHNIVVPEITEGTNLSTLAIRDGDTFLQLGVDYTVSAQVVDDSVVVVVQFIGNYSGQVVRTYKGTTIVTNEHPLVSPTPQVTSTPVPPSPTPYNGGGEGSNGIPQVPPQGGSTGTQGGNTGTQGGNTGSQPDPTNTPATNTNAKPVATPQGSGGTSDPTGATDTNTP